MHALRHIAGHRPLLSQGEVATAVQYREPSRQSYDVRLVDGRLLVQGDNMYGQLGVGDEFGIPVHRVLTPTYLHTSEPIRELLDLQSMSVFAITETGRLIASGVHTLLIFPQENCATPNHQTSTFREIPLPAPVRQSASNRGLILLETGAVWTYGPLDGPLDGQPDADLAPLAYKWPTPVTMVAATISAHYLVTADGTLHIAGSHSAVGGTARTALREYAPAPLQDVNWQPLQVAQVYAYGNRLMLVDRCGRLYCSIPTATATGTRTHLRHVATPGPVADAAMIYRGVLIRCRDGRRFTGDGSGEWHEDRPRWDEADCGE